MRAIACAPSRASSACSPSWRIMLAKISRAEALSSAINTRLPTNSAVLLIRRGDASACSPNWAQKWNVEPMPGSLSTHMRPCICSTRLLEMTSPSPVPPYLRVVEASAWLNDWNNRPHCSGDMPMPESRTLMCSST